nr:hypothetical protein GCM10020185_12060 [Pseudomonas brassicacearum subsp. brassicacearum]
MIRMEDVAKVLQAEPQGFDAIMLDVDNGPEGLTQKANSWLYSAGGLAACAKALRPKGVLAVWSASADRQFFRQAEEGRLQGRRGASVRPWQQRHPPHHLDCREAQGLS